MAVETHIEYVVYYTSHKQKDGLSANPEKLKLIKVEFHGPTSNSFDSEQEALDAMIHYKLNYMDFVILKQYRLFNF